MPFSPIIPSSGVAGYNYLSRTRIDQQALLRQVPEFQRELELFEGEIGKIQTSDDLLDNYQLMKVALGAFGLDDDLGNRGFMKAVLDSDPDNEGSFVNRLADKRYLEFARAFNFGGSGGPQLEELSDVNSIKAQIEALGSADDLLADGDLLRAALDTFGLGDDQKNTHFLKLVLTSDPADPASFAKSLSDSRYAELAESFGFGARLRDGNDMLGYADKMRPALETMRTAQDLLDQPELLAATAQFFGLDDDGTDTAFWEQVLNSDVSDETSFANRQDDARYADIARAFAFGAPNFDAATDTRKIETFVNAVEGRTSPYADTSEFFNDVTVLLAVFDVLNVPNQDRKTAYAGRVIASDPSDPNALINIEPDPRYAALQKALNFQPAQTGHSYPEGFADAIAQRYVDKQFEVAVGNVNAELRIALSFETDLDGIVQNGTSNDSRWFGVMSSRPLRAVFEGVFGLSSGFGTLDIDQQLKVLKERSEASFGTSELSELNTPETRDSIRDAYLLNSSVAASGFSSSANAVLALLAT